ncbi:L,D-transpeptidase [Rhizobium sp. PDO1-076]|uniref:L,D-transpeptidase n=1 Tax=Rhizobium sp. PDO1-076 TaxID=1125979 RepID=UPI001FCAAB1F|nr:L,D-transpeptidase [Rhizobium sp. PDO1-076]
MDFNPQEIYGATSDRDIVLPAVNYQKLRPDLHRQIVVDPTAAQAGTIVVRLEEYHLYFSRGDGTAIRYGVGIGADGFAWSGAGVIGRKTSWPRWTPTAEMKARDPGLSVYSSGKEGGVENPLGARALYIYKGALDTLNRVHGTPEWWSIGREISSGCIRMLNQDVIDLYARTPMGANILVS